MAKPKQSPKSSAASGRIRVGIGGWSYAPWRGAFYPKGLKQADELSYATSKLTSIEINATHYRLQSLKSFHEDDFGKFLDLLPHELYGQKLNHVVEGRHASFATPRFVELARDAGVTIAYVDAEGWPNIADLTGEVVYARLQRGDDAL